MQDFLKSFNAKKKKEKRKDAKKKEQEERMGRILENSKSPQPSLKF